MHSCCSVSCWHTHLTHLDNTKGGLVRSAYVLPCGNFVHVHAGVIKRPFQLLCLKYWVKWELKLIKTHWSKSIVNKVSEEHKSLCHFLMDEHSRGGILYWNHVFWKVLTRKEEKASLGFESQSIILPQGYSWTTILKWRSTIWVIIFKWRSMFLWNALVCRKLPSLPHWDTTKPLSW